MRFNQLFSLVLIGLLHACGNSGGDRGPAAPIDVPKVDGSSRHGLIFAAVNVDQSLKTSRIYKYDFDEGVVTEILPGESGNPGVFTVSRKVYLFNRQAGSDKSLRVIDPEAGTAEPAVVLEGLADGDPMDVSLYDTDTSLLLASPIGGKLQSLDLKTNTLADVPVTGAVPAALRPIGLHRVAAEVGIVHSGLAGFAGGAPHADDTQALLKGKVVGAGVSDVVSTKLTGSNPSGFVNRDTLNAVVVGLCSEGMTGCDGGSDRILENAVTASYPYAAAFGYDFFNQIVDGPDAKTVYAHVKTPELDHAVVKLSIETQSAIVVHKFADERLYGIAYDSSSRTLFVGGTEDLKGSVTLYKDDVKAGSFQIDGVLYSAAFY